MEQDHGTKDLEPLEHLRGWRVTEGDPDIRGWPLLDKTGERVGRIADLLVSPQAGKAVFAMVAYGGTLGLGGHKTLMPIDKLHIERARKFVIFDDTKAHLKTGPNYRQDVRDYSMYYSHWGTPARTDTGTAQTEHQ